MSGAVPGAKDRPRLDRSTMAKMHTFGLAEPPVVARRAKARHALAEKIYETAGKRPVR
jgi:hypothetical protein